MQKANQSLVHETASLWMKKARMGVGMVEDEGNGIEKNNCNV